MIRLLTHSSIKIEDKNIIYVDPFKIIEEVHDADLILVTHDHFDHFSKEDIEKVINKDTIILCPTSLKEKCEDITSNVIAIKPNESIKVFNSEINTVRSYNQNKKFHPKENDWLGYLINTKEGLVYIVGDSDVNEDILKVKCDILMVPIGGTYTMDYKEASEYTNTIKPRLVIPTHYGDVAGDKECVIRFKELINKDIKVDIRMEY